MRRVATSPKPKHAPAKPRRPPGARGPAARSYHHGDLRRVLVDAAFELVGEGGAGGVERPRGRPPCRGFAGSAVPPFRQPRGAAGRGGGRGAAAPWSRGRADAGQAPADDPLQRFRAVLGSPMCAGRRATPPISKSSPAAGRSTTGKSAVVTAGNAEVIGLTERLLRKPTLAGNSAHRT